MNKSRWYEDWFNSPYYHLLYNNRNEAEAEFFIANLCRKLNLTAGAKLWDLACGKGRHAIALNKMGYDVTGTDLSENNIERAGKYSNTRLHFMVHDMRQAFTKNNFNAVLNLFTSIGYFDAREDNFSVFANVSSSLKPNGVFVIDFFNSTKVRANLPATYVEKRNHIVFNIRKEVVEQKIVKKIQFIDQDKEYRYEEKVSLLEKKDFEEFGQKAGLQPEAIFGNYALEAFDEKKSDRLIIVFKKQSA